MRSEQEMYDIILSVAKSDERVRAVYMNGSRTNPNVQKDKYRDYDIVFVVSTTQPFLKDKSWVSVFDDFAIVQEPDTNDLDWGLNHNFIRSYTWLMLFTDGNRIDLGIKVLDCALEDYLSDSLRIKLLDKDNILPDIRESNDSLRDQMPYAQRMYIRIGW